MLLLLLHCGTQQAEMRQRRGLFVPSSDGRTHIGGAECMDRVGVCANWGVNGTHIREASIWGSKGSCVPGLGGESGFPLPSHQPPPGGHTRESQGSPVGVCLVRKPVVSEAGFSLGTVCAAGMKTDEGDGQRPHFHPSGVGNCKRLGQAASAETGAALGPRATALAGAATELGDKASRSHKPGAHMTSKAGLLLLRGT